MKKEGHPNYKTVTVTCVTCGKTKTERINAIGHQLENGICQNCGYQDETVKPGKPNKPGKPGFGFIWDWIAGWWNRT